MHSYGSPSCVSRTSTKTRRTSARSAFLDACDCCDNEAGVLSAIQALDDRRIKGLGPAAANLLYFLHPTLVMPFNTAIVRGYNTVTGARVKLGRWDGYLAMRRGVLALNQTYRPLLSNDLGAIAGFLFDVGTGRLPVPVPGTDRARWDAELAQVRADAAAERRRQAEAAEDNSHTQVQGWLRDLGRALGYQVWVAANDHGKSYARAQFARPAFARVMDMDLQFLAYSNLAAHRHDMARFGQGLRPLEAVARPLRGPG